MLMFTAHYVIEKENLFNSSHSIDYRIDFYSNFFYISIEFRKQAYESNLTGSGI